ncbi:hypothetical protein GQ55_1G093400 [Panicum hallii var. hallii]|uniref:Uncharacterized protein n=1 Tax=Panicum hallii var. hallii TaxID=1504633 RepID=A0A2T7F3X2_9POAL|nr:hypothetical protein GQ55_1G093400 [Panicum hallii var. hallii]
MVRANGCSSVCVCALKMHGGATRHMVCLSCFGMNDWIAGWYTCRCVLFGPSICSICFCASDLIGSCQDVLLMPVPSRLFIHPEQSSSVYVCTATATCTDY